MRLLIVSLLLCSSCATTMVPLNEATPVPVDRVFAFQKKTGDDMGVIIITRDQGLMYHALYLGFSINGKFAACFDTGETAQFHVPAGENLLKVGLVGHAHSSDCPDEFHTSTTRETVVKPNETKYFRLMFSDAGEVDVQRSEQ